METYRNNIRNNPQIGSFVHVMQGYVEILWYSMNIYSDPEDKICSPSSIS